MLIISLDKKNIYLIYDRDFAIIMDETDSTYIISTS